MLACSFLEYGFQVSLGVLSTSALGGIFEPHQREMFAHMGSPASSLLNFAKIIPVGGLTFPSGRVNQLMSTNQLKFTRKLPWWPWRARLGVLIQLAVNSAISQVKEST